ncbi:MAG: adenosylcobinamide-GDP ribazoletransferase [Blastocatellia bacterium]|nr:adenosylcobinamide-GDP ribazoletransferase [Blastocatellia bacterium]
MIRGFLIAVGFLTRLPVRLSPDVTEEEIGRAAGFFPLVGVIVGGGGALLYAGLKPALPHATCILMVLIYLAFITGGFHEDGLADSLDGLGGGRTKERALEIMRDSRIGTFGALGLIFLVLAKYNLLSILEEKQLWRWLIFAHTASRWTSLPLSMWLPYARSEGQGKLVARRTGGPALVIATATLAAVSSLLPLRVALLALGVVFVAVTLSGFYYRRRLDGITGDCLGATNQITEVALYLCAIVISKTWAAA